MTRTTNVASRQTRTTDAPCGTPVVFKGEQYISRGSPAPGKLTIERADDHRSWRVIPAHEASIAQAG